MSREKRVIKKAICFFCHSYGSLLVHVQDSLVVKVRGNPAHLISRGFIYERALRTPK
ncbi:hypothetical protein ACFL1Z_04930 [Thermodesulfobacteriota bacterium]